ncbi:unnamed protein product [Urochloa humidicola]
MPPPNPGSTAISHRSAGGAPAARPHRPRARLLRRAGLPPLTLPLRPVVSTRLQQPRNPNPRTTNLAGASPRRRRRPARLQRLSPPDPQPPSRPFPRELVAGARPHRRRRLDPSHANSSPELTPAAAAALPVSGGSRRQIHHRYLEPSHANSSPKVAEKWLELEKNLAGGEAGGGRRVGERRRGAG